MKKNMIDELCDNVEYLRKKYPNSLHNQSDSTKEQYIKLITQIFRELYITPPELISNQPLLGFSASELEYVKGLVEIKYNSSEDLFEISYKGKEVNICALPMEEMKNELKHFFRKVYEKS